MSVQQLNRLVIEKEKLLREYERTKTIIKVSEACDSLLSFSKTTADPFMPEWKGTNPWLFSPDPGNCHCTIA